MAYYNVCSNCGCNLDPGEKCDCEREKIKQEEKYQKLFKVDRRGQMAMNFSKEVAYERQVAI